MHNNNIGLIRLGFASLVIISHAYLITGNSTLEPLVTYTGSFGLGSLAVDGFFVMSGYLITQSMVRTRSQGDYLLKRLLRIYPAYLAAYAIGGALAASIRPDYPIELWRALFLFYPVTIPTPGGGQDFNANLSAWTIAHEFRCYLGVMLLAALGLLSERRRVLGLTILLWSLFVLIKLPELWRIRAWVMPVPAQILIGVPFHSLRFFAAFSIGMTVYLYRDAIIPRLNGWVASLALGGIALTIAGPLLGEPLLLPFTAAIIFWIAFRTDLGPLQVINDRWDISYGTYLYGWPVGNLLIWMKPDWQIGPLIAANLAGAWALGALSWFLLERHLHIGLLNRYASGARRAEG